jgi:hypothetical protein
MVGTRCIRGLKVRAGSSTGSDPAVVSANRSDLGTSRCSGPVTFFLNLAAVR